MKREKTHPCKLGTVPRLVVFRYNYTPTVGKVITVRDSKHGSKWFRVLVTRVGPEHYFFADLI